MWQEQEGLIGEYGLQRPSLSLLQDELYLRHGVEVWMLRLDEVHPVISGNKIFKLYYFLREAKASSKKIVTCGGAYSNHLAATAFACSTIGITSTGIVRGEEPQELSHTLLFCRRQGMQLHFVSRSEYKELTQTDHPPAIIKKHEDAVWIPEGGFSRKGKEGASLISGFFDEKDFDILCVSTGTATTLAGILDAAQKKVMAFSALKNQHDLGERMQLLGVAFSNYTLVNDYHFGGYARWNQELIGFMNRFYEKHHVPLDFVYTGKMMYGLEDLIAKGYFHHGTRILCMHTGGLQGNLSLPAGTLLY